MEEVTVLADVTVDPPNRPKVQIQEISRKRLSAYMSKLGAKGGKVSGAKRMEMPKKERIAIAKKAAAARWAKG